MKFNRFIALVLFVAGCSSHNSPDQPVWNPEKPTQRTQGWEPYIEQASQQWGISPRLITAIIAVESGGNPTVVSRSNAVGLMQIKASTAGREVYRRLGKGGQPSNSDLKDPQQNISIGTAYLNIMAHGQLAGIEDPKTMQYALMVAYANGAGALLRTFSSDPETAIEKINDLSPEEFYQYIMKHHPSAQAPRYLYKMTRAMEAI